MWEMWKMGSSPEGSVGNFTSTSLRKMGCKTSAELELYCRVCTGAFSTHQLTAGLFHAPSISPFLPPVFLQKILKADRDRGACIARGHSWREPSRAEFPPPESSECCSPSAPSNTRALMEEFYSSKTSKASFLISLEHTATLPAISS